MEVTTNTVKKLKKIGTLTFHNCDNYGAVLQAYALQQVLLEMGFDTEIIDYTRDNLSDTFHMFMTKIISTLKGKPDRQLYSTKEFFEMVFHGDGNSKDIHESFVRFRKEHFICSKPVNKRTIKTIEKEYDYIIVGSDQIWNCGRVNLEPTYMLDFVSNNRKKVSYAASFGISEIPEKYKETYCRLLAKFAHISVREKQGVSLIKMLTGKEAAWVLDPTLLLGKDDWRKIVDRCVKKEKHYILVYHLGESNRIREIANKLSSETGLPIRFVRKQKSKTDSAVVKGVSPTEWVALFLKADYVITSSFHGVAFSINFNKQFYAVKPEDRIRQAMQSRLADILDRMELSSRYIESFDEIELGRTIAYDKVNCMLDDLRKMSKEYLRKVLFEYEYGSIY